MYKIYITIMCKLYDVYHTRIENVHDLLVFYTHRVDNITNKITPLDLGSDFIETPYGHYIFTIIFTQHVLTIKKVKNINPITII